ncbi:MAG: ATP-binding protein, partial [Chloroflexota bacterium]|nr:ATP-binding protein [Chloroflexota bacterium]
MTERVLLAWSGGKDSALALHEIHKTDACRVMALLTTVTEDFDRISMHGVRRQLLEKQARSLGYPLEIVFISEHCANEEYESKMQGVLKKWSQQGVTSVVFGDVFLDDIRAYRERNLGRAGMGGIFPLWGSDSGELARRF